MPKRPNPFGDASPLQMKTHVGTKEINFLGMDGDKNMKTVYEKTKQLLFTGAQKQLDDINIDANENCASIPNQNVSGQMCLDNTGHIVPPSVPSVQPPTPTDDDNDEDGMDVDAVLVDTNTNKKISDFFTVKNIAEQRQKDIPQKPSL
ncbi:uncharacterized protein LOC127738736 [Mytilus californianus]|uniref:uncharacterized protein LOC127738736 n=1 Tax=Mytilus californianus TaxID=6549 RepID=UPI00224711E7|nr:uncharacterized protein LOC127738736 [Mytilus californianus]